MGSTDQSSRSASLTSIVEMYQRPITSSSTCPAMRPIGTLYYDYTEDFHDPSLEVTRQPEMPISPVPHRAGGGAKPTILQQDMELKMHGAIHSPLVPSPVHLVHQRGHDRANSSIDESFDSYLQGSHDDSIEEIERAIANAISSAAADKLMAASEHLNTYTDALRSRRSENETNLTNGPNLSRRLPATERQYGLRTAASNNEMNNSTRRASQLNLNKNAMALDPAFADFTSLLSSFERLAKSPFSRLSDEDDVDERHSRRSSKLSTMETLDEIEATEKRYLKRHCHNMATARAGSPALSTSGSLAEHPLSLGEDITVLAPEPLSPHRKRKDQPELHQRFMKALPPIPAEIPALHHTRDVYGSTDKQRKIDSAISQVRSLSLRSHLSRSGSPGKLKLRSRPPSSFGDIDHAIVSNGARRQRRSADECRSSTNIDPPPRLKLKISRNQLGLGRNAQTGSVIRNNRLKQCNALADVARPPHADRDKKTDKAQDMAGIKEHNERPEPFTTGFGLRDSAGGSCQPSDQFNLSYPSTPVESADVMLPRPSPFRESVEEMRTVQSEPGEAASRRVKPKFSFLRLRPVNSAAHTTLTKPAPGPLYNNYSPDTNVAQSKKTGAAVGQFDSTVSENADKSASVKSERVGNRVRRWAADAKRVVRSYVRRTLIRSPKSAATY